MTRDDDAAHVERERFPGTLDTPYGFVAYATALAALIGAHELVPPLVVRTSPTYGTVELRVSTTVALGAWAGALGGNRPYRDVAILTTFGEVGGRRTDVIMPAPRCSTCGTHADVVWSSLLPENPDYVDPGDPHPLDPASRQLRETNRYNPVPLAYLPVGVRCPMQHDDDRPTSTTGAGA